MADDLITTPQHAIDQLTVKLAPADIEVLQDDPEALAQLSRAQLAVVQTTMVHKLLTNPDATPSQFSQVHERLTKTAKLEGKESGAGNGTKLIINFIRAGDKESITIEGSAREIPDEQHKIGAV